ncbi:D-cysteine desulfhydrase family protein [Variovorax sp. VRV01]|uniref:D-cysteine desulfhydrase family protein n=1 Tax=Variovorax sp. VRV01 TaxID=2769259 RepID=UPI001783F104|nr:D-cysteine desulfhydrase family protein [Variovorax sp. VRV01]MBD9667094.1 D-cysteine desulfhydrase family protein [Variovorax sp. VRV01]
MALSLEQVPVAQTGVYPTPLQPLERLSRQLGGARLWVKRDDLTGLAFGGSKTRSLGTLLGRALAEGANTVITCGPTTSNHVRLTAAAANQLGLKVVLVLRQPKDGAPALQGNMLLNQVLGARLVYAEVDGLAGLEPVMEQVAEALRGQGAKPFIIPGGGYSPTGALGYIGLVQELAQQSQAAGFGIDAVVFASGSGCIQSGLLLGALATGTRLPVIGLTINRSVAELVPRIHHDVQAAAALIGLDGHLPADAVQVLDDYIGQGYAIPSEAGMEAIDLLAREEGLLLDPCYTGKSMAGAMDLARLRFKPGQNVVFIHTGGTPGIFSYADALVRPHGDAAHSAQLAGSAH